MTKGKHHSSSLLKAFQIRLFFNTSIFHFIGTLNVLYLLTLKYVVGYYKLWNEVMVWFTQIICYNVYIPLLIRQAGPTIFDITDATITVKCYCNREK